MFQEVRGPRENRSPDAMLALLELSRAGIAPAEDERPAAWDAMADAYQAAGEPARAADADDRAADLAEATGHPAEAAGYRLRAGAFAFQAGRFELADADLSRVVDDPKAGDIRPRAGMLRALARGRALATGSPGASAASYAEALEHQIRDFPDEPVTHEARWLLGEFLANPGSPSNGDRARSLWKAIPTTSPRWLPSRLAIAALDRDGLDRELINPHRRRLRMPSRRPISSWPIVWISPPPMPTRPSSSWPAPG